MRLAAEGNGVDVVESRRVLVARHEIHLVARQRAAAHQQVVVRGRRQRFCQQDATLEIIDIVVDARGQVDHAGDQPRNLVAYFDAQALRAGQEVLVLEEVERATGAAEFLVAADRAGLRGERIHGVTLVAELRRSARLVVEVRAVQTTVDARQLVVHVGNLEVAPLAEVVILADAHEELAHRGRHFLHGAVVAIRRVVVITVDTTEQRVRRLVQEVAEDVVDRSFTRIGTGRQAPVIPEFAVDEEREAAIDRRVVVVR